MTDIPGKRELAVRTTALDWLLARRACALSLGFAAVLAVIVVSTDEQSTTLGSRLARFASLLSVAGSAGAFLAAEQARSRGEVRALAALGVPPSRAAFGAALGGIAVALLGAALVVWPGIDLSPLFPRPDDAGLKFSPVGPDLALEPTLGVWIRSSGALHTLDQHDWGAAKVIWGFPRGATAAALVVMALCAPYWASLRIGLARRTLVGAAAVVTCVFAFHAVGAGRAPGWVLPLGALVLVADCGFLGYRERT